ncbi:MAG TPA: hypothetical protein PK156_26765 [Polyangium sp.]|nr:hypothetical protein [Polyangium sp.]
MIVQCGHCGAPLDVREGVSVLTCKYCGKANERQRLRTISTQTPPDFRPPRQWVPPPEFPASSNVPLSYHPNRAPLVIALSIIPVLMGIGIAIFVGAAGRGTKRTIGGSGGSLLSSGATPAMLAAVNLNQNPTALAQALGGRPSERSVHVTLSDPRFEYVSFSWDEKYPDHPTNFYLAARKGVLPDARMQQVLATRLHGGLENGSWNWFGGSGLYMQKDSATLSGNAQVTLRGASGESENPRWKDKLAAVWKVALEAAFALPVTFAQNDVFELLGAGHPLAKLASIEATTTVETAPATMKRLFPGSSVSTFISLDIDVSVEHPLFKHADMAWKNEKGGQLQSVHFRPKPSWASRREAFVECIGGKLGKPEVREADYVNKKRDYEFRSNQVRLLIPESMAYIVGYGKGVLGPDYVKVIGAVNDCK